MGHPLHLTVPDGLPFIDFEREFDHPVADVFRAHADPDLFRQWIGPRGLRTRIDGFEFRPGGAYRFVQRGEDGAEEYAFRGVFHTVRENELVVQTFEYEGWPDAVDLEYLHFEDRGDGGCRLRGHTVHASQEARDGMVGSGMEKGMAEGYERLEELLTGRPAQEGA